MPRIPSLHLRQWINRYVSWPLIVLTLLLLFSQSIFVLSQFRHTIARQTESMEQFRSFVRGTMIPNQIGILNQLAAHMIGEYGGGQILYCTGFSEVVWSFPLSTKECRLSNKFLEGIRIISVFENQDYPKIIFSLPYFSQPYLFLTVILVSFLIVGMSLFLMARIRSAIFGSLLPQIKSLGKKESLQPDIHELNETHQSLLEYQKKEKEFVANLSRVHLSQQVAHDIKSPLAALSVLQQDLQELPEEKRLLLRSAVQRIHDIANDLSKKKTPDNSHSGNQETSSTKENQEAQSIQLLSSIIDTLVSEKRLQFRSKINTVIEANLGSESYGLFAKVQQREFKRLLSNLINNAVEAMGEAGGTVRVSLKYGGRWTVDGGCQAQSDSPLVTDVTSGLSDQSVHKKSPFEITPASAVQRQPSTDTIESDACKLASPPMITISISDTGQGIPPDILPKLMQRGETHGKSGGSGLGLYHAKTTIESWGGDVQLASELGKGTTVTVTLPQEPAPAWFVPKLEIASGATVIIVDDDNSIHQIWRGRLEKFVKEQNIKVKHFSTPAELVNAEFWGDSGRRWTADCGRKAQSDSPLVTDATKILSDNFVSQTGSCDANSASTVHRPPSTDTIESNAFKLTSTVQRPPSTVSNSLLILCDHEFLGQEKTGLDVIEELGLAKNAILVTSHFEEPKIRERCQKLGVQLIPKNLAGFVPLNACRFGSVHQVGTNLRTHPHPSNLIKNANSPSPSLVPQERGQGGEFSVSTLDKSGYDAILIDDDPLVHMNWKTKARISGKRIKTFVNPENLFKNLDAIAKDTPIYVDSNLGENISGEDVTLKLSELGFTRLYLATGFDKSKFADMPWIHDVIGKMPPWT